MPGRILIVDDIPTNRILLRVRLASAFYDVIQASTAKEALQMLSLHKPDLVLLSARLGNCDSLSLCRAITGISPHPDDPPDQIDPDDLPDSGAIRPPVLILTGLSDRHRRLAALKAGAEDVLAFPLE
ncbi:MAG: response regulator, partial [Rhodobacterales bacterium]